MSPPPSHRIKFRIETKGNQHAHFLGLGRGTAGDLLDAERAQLRLQLIQLLGEVVLALAPELTSLDLGRRLETSNQHQNTGRGHAGTAAYHGGGW